MINQKNRQHPGAEHKRSVNIIGLQIDLSKQGGFMSVKSYLSQVRKLNHAIDMLVREREMIWSDLAAPGVHAMEDTKIMKSTSFPEDKYVRYQELCDKINLRVDRLITQRHVIIGQIEALKDIRYRVVLTKFYIEQCSINQISHELMYSDEYVRHLLVDARRAFGRMYPELEQHCDICTRMTKDNTK